MKFFATALVAAAYHAKLALGTELGQSCVTGVLGKVFKRINASRVMPTAAVEKKRYEDEVASAANANWGANAGAASKWTML